ncbi:MAG: glycosyltransferase, exosortase A system-associated [bacterium]|nr:glycosyltransferase, exosortase A system-associated [bacterium]
MKILHVLNHSLPHYLTGYSIRSKYIVEFQKKLGLSPAVITSPKHSKGTEDMDMVDGIPYYRSRISASKHIPYLTELTIMKSLQRDILSLFKEHPFQIIHAHSPVLCGRPGQLAAKSLNIPVIYEVRALWEEAAVESGISVTGSLRYHLTRLIESSLLRKVNMVTTICQGLKDNLVQRGLNEEKIEVIPNGVDTLKFYPRHKKWDVLETYRLTHKLVVGFIGSFFRFEGLEFLVRAVPKILKRYPETRFLLIGGGEEEENLKKMVTDMEIGKEVIFTGRVPHDQILDYYSIVDIFVYPRINTPLTNMVTGLKLLEAMSLEKVVLASDVGGNKELVKDGRTGMLFRAEDVDDLVLKCSDLISNENRRKTMAMEARRDMVNHRDWAKIVPKYLEVYNKCLRSSM